MDTKVFLESLKTQHETFKNGEMTIESLLDNIACYESFIPEFFSKTGEADGIREMYTGIRNNLDNEKTIMCIDINNTANIYNEYMEGMSKFITDITAIEITEATNELTVFKENFNVAKQNDSIFIESLYDGKLKENEKMEVPLSEAVANIEFLIDFIPQMSMIKESCISLYNSTKEQPNNDCAELVNDGLKMLFESVDKYCYSTISNIVTTYSDIKDKLFNENTEDDTDGKPVYQLF